MIYDLGFFGEHIFVWIFSSPPVNDVRYLGMSVLGMSSIFLFDHIPEMVSSRCRTESMTHVQKNGDVSTNFF